VLAGALQSQRRNGFRGSTLSQTGNIPWSQWGIALYRESRVLAMVVENRFWESAMIAITCPMAGQHEKKVPKAFQLDPFDEDRAICPECKWETTPEWELARMYNFREAGGGGLEDHQSLTEMRNYANWLNLSVPQENSCKGTKPSQPSSRSSRLYHE